MAAIVAMTLMWLCAATASAATPDTNSVAPLPEEKTLTASLITCWPGPEVYELCGHEALRIRGEGCDSVWNYGVFDFNEPNFIYRYVKGQTDYMLAGYPFQWFMPEYQAQRRRVVEQDLNLTQEEVRRLRALLQEEALPANRRYRYNYVKDNCATRILDRMDQAADTVIVYDDSVHYGTFRTEMRSYHRDYPWYQFGIDLALGSGIDYNLKGREEMFVPLEMMRRVANARFADGRPLVGHTRVLNEGSADATLGPSSPLTSPMAVTILMAVLAVILSLHDIIRKRITRWGYSLFFLLTGLLGCVSFFLVFFSSHEATSPNILVIWLNPLQLLAGIFLWWRRTRVVTAAVCCYNVVAVLSMLIVWPFQHQSANPAIFPLAAAAVLLSATYAILVFNHSYKNSGPAPAAQQPRGRSIGRRRSPAKGKSSNKRK